MLSGSRYSGIDGCRPSRDRDVRCPAQVATGYDRCTAGYFYIFSAPARGAGLHISTKYQPTFAQKVWMPRCMRSGIVRTAMDWMYRIQLAAMP